MCTYNGMSANGKNQKDGVVPEFIGYRTQQLAPLLSKWRSLNPDVPWGKLITRALRNELKPLATKREQHLMAA
jgi:hypothetical protein